MAGFALDGLASGMQTSSMIKAIMGVERIPQQQIKGKIDDAESAVKALQGINSKVAALRTAAKDFSSDAVWSKYTGNSSSETVTVAASSTAAAGSLTFDVTKVAQRHSEVLPEIAVDPNAAAVDPKDVAVTVDTGPPAVLNVATPMVDPRAIASAINTSKTGYTAQAIQVEPNKYKLVVMATEAGADKAFSVTINTTPPGVPINSTTMQAGSDAEITVGAGTPEAFTVSSSTNTFKNIAQGVDITVSELATGVEANIEKDTKTVADQVGKMVDAINTVFKEIDLVTHVAPQGSPGSGKLVGSSIMRNLDTQILQASSGFAAGTTASVAGLEVNRNGTVEFDKTKFIALLESDPELAKAIVSDIAGRVESVAESFSDSSTGQISLAIESKESNIKQLNDQVDRWDTRLAMREQSLVRQFTAMESAMNKFQGQQQWLMQQIAGLNASSGS